MLNEIKEKWNEILNTMKIEYDISDVSFKVWLQPLVVHSVENGIITIVAKDQQAVNYMENKYSSYFIVTIAEVMNCEFDIKFISKSDVPNYKTPAAKPVTVDESLITDAGLNPKYTFDTFVVGDNNNFAHAASLSVADFPGQQYNPLFIHGGAGLGKTHLMHAIGNYIIKNNPNLKVLYVTSEIFTNELIESIKEKNSANQKFRDKYRNVDVLLIDDIQFIIGRESTQNEFFHTFNDLREANKQVIISSDRPPKEFDSLNERLKSRFINGLIVDIKPPNYETRMAILHKKSDIEGYNISDEVFEYLATNIKSNIRELEGSLNQLVAYSRFTHTNKIDLRFAEDVLKDIISPNAHREVTPELIIQIVAEHFQISVEDISSQKRDQKIARPRQIAMYLCRSMTDIPLKTIGSYMGNKDHTTVGYGADKIYKEMQTDESLKNAIDIITKKINPS